MRDKIVLFAMIRLLILQNTFHLLCVSKCIAKYLLLHINVINYAEYFTIIASLGIDLFSRLLKKSALKDVIPAATI